MIDKSILIENLNNLKNIYLEKATKEQIRIIDDLSTSDNIKRCIKILSDMNSIEVIDIIIDYIKYNQLNINFH